jgi:hypothetical protein
MADIVFVLVALGFFGACVLYVRAVDRMVPATDDVTEAPSEARR